MTTNHIPQSILRVIDASEDRCREGLRVLDDVARLMLDDSALTAKLRDARHMLASAIQPLGNALLSARDAESDVGASESSPSAAHADVTALVRANARRAEEALRTLEEFARLPEVDGFFDSGKLSNVRFLVYDLERELVGRLSRQAAVAKITGVYVILDPAMTRDRPMLEVAEAALAGGATVIQYRDKVREKGLQLPIAIELRELCHRYGALLIINDDPALTLASGADGVHLGQKDLPISAARAILPLSCIIGNSNATLDEVRAADAEGADYIAVGAIYDTSSKSDTRPAGLETLRQVRAITKRPIVAIGGINADNVAPVIEAGADAVSVISAVVGATDPRAATELLLQRIEAQRERSGPRA